MYIARLPHPAAAPAAAAPLPGLAGDDLDLDRTVWDPEYRRVVIQLLASDPPCSGDAETPD